MDEKIRVLLVDDEKSLLLPLTDRLRKHGFAITTAESGPEALEKATVAKGEFDVAIIDQLMPPPDGIETMRLLHQEYPGIEAIILTGWADLEAGQRALDMGAYRYMRKPFDPEELALSIRTAARFGQERQRRHALQALVRAGERMGTAENAHQLYEKLCDEVRNLLPQLDTFLVARWHESTGEVSFPYCCIRGTVTTLPTRSGHRGLAEYVIESKSPLLLPDGDKAFREQHGLQPPAPSLGYCASEITVPMLLSGRVLGSLHAMTFNPRVRYRQEHLEVLLAFANQAAVAVQNIEQLDKARRLQEASSALAMQRGRDEVMQTIVHEAHRLIDADFTGFILQDRDGRLYRGPREEPQGFSRCLEEPRQEGGLTRDIINKRELRYIADVSKEPLVKDEVKKAGIRSLLGMPLIHADRVLGVLYAHTFQERHFDQHDIDLWSAFAGQAAAVLHSILDEEQDVKRLGTFVDLLRSYQQRHDIAAIANQIAAALPTVLDVDVCTIVEYAADSGSFATRGAAGLRHPEAAYSIGDAYKQLLLNRREPICIPDVAMFDLMQASDFVERETIKSSRIYPLWVGETPVGLLFANWRETKTLSRDEARALGLFADLAALVLHETRLQADLARTRRRLERNMFLTWVSMLEDTWRHSFIQKAAAIRNYAGSLVKMMPAQTPAAMNGVKEAVQEIDRLATEIANAPVRVPQSFEMEAEDFPLARLLRGIADHENARPILPGQPRVTVVTDLDAIGGMQIRGWRRWLIYAFEALMENARKAMRNGGTITIKGSRTDQWAEIRFTDQGSGVPPAVRDKLFKELIAKEQDTTGMGIGALLVATIIEEHGGTVELEKPGPGDTTVLIRLPVTAGAPARP